MNTIYLLGDEFSRTQKNIYQHFSNIITIDHMFFLIWYNVVYRNLKLFGQTSHGADFIVWREQAMSTMCSPPGRVHKRERVFCISRFIGLVTDTISHKNTGWYFCNLNGIVFEHSNKSINIFNKNNQLRSLGINTLRHN